MGLLSGSNRHGSIGSGGVGVAITAASAQSNGSSLNVPSLHGYRPVSSS